MLAIQSSGTLRERTQRLTKALEVAMTALAETSDELQLEVEQGQRLVTKLERDAHTYEELAKVSRDQAEAVAVLVRGEVKAEGRRSFWTQLWVQFVLGVVFFVAGVIVTLALGP
jgi:hypothetical protein